MKTQTLKSLHRQLINIYLDDPDASHNLSELLQAVAPTVKPLRGPNRAYNALHRTSTRDLVMDYLTEHCSGAYELALDGHDLTITFYRGLIDCYLAASVGSEDNDVVSEDNDVVSEDNDVVSEPEDSLFG